MATEKAAAKAATKPAAKTAAKTASKADGGVKLVVTTKFRDLQANERIRPVGEVFEADPERAAQLADKLGLCERAGE